MVRSTTTQEWNDTQLLKLSDAARLVPRITGDDTAPNPSTIYRWVTRGVAGVRLESLWASGGLRTSERWLREFFAAVSEAKLGSSSTRPPEPIKKPTRKWDVDAELDREGL